MTQRVVIAHDYLTQRGGAERVVLAMLRAFPDARLVTSVYDPDGTFPEFRDYDVRTTWLDRLRPLQKDPRRALPLLPHAFGHLRITDADLVLCSSSGFAHGVANGDIPKIVYCHNPPRWLHQTADYLDSQPAPVRVALELLRRPLTKWDRLAAGSATAYVANSSAVRERIARAYDIEADIVPPPIGIDPNGVQEPVPGLTPGFLLSVSRARGYKNASAICEAVEQLPAERLVVVGGLPERPDGCSWSSRLTGVSGISDAQLRWLYANCAALLAVSHEDFGLTPLEANAFGKPAACLRSGGYLDTMRPGRTGVFVHELTTDAVVDGIMRVQGTDFSPTAIKAHAERYSLGVFAERLHALADEIRDVRAAATAGQVRVPAQRQPGRQPVAAA